MAPANWCCGRIPWSWRLDTDEKEHPIVLAKNVKGFEMQFWDANKNPPEWVDEWEGPKTNQLPKMVMITLKLADNPHSSRITEEITRIISIPAMTVQPVWQVPRGMGGPELRRPRQSGRPCAPEPREAWHAWHTRRLPQPAMSSASPSSRRSAPLAHRASRHVSRTLHAAFTSLSHPSHSILPNAASP